MTKIKDILLAKGIRPTYQRLIIFKYMDEKRIHPDVDTIYLSVKDEVPTISRTTVYNTLHLFIEKGLVKEITITGNMSHYDIVGQPHHHLLCKTCNKIYDLPYECCFHSTGLINGHQVDGMQGYFMGKCRNCVQKEQSEYQH